MKLSIVDQSPIPAGSTAADALQNSIDLARLADRLGYERYWVAEHHAMRSLASPAPEILLARLTGETRHIRLGSGGVLLPYYAPLKVAEAFRMLYALAPGRIDLGIGRAPGGTSLEMHALQRTPDPQFGRDFPQQVVDLWSFLNKGFPQSDQYAAIHVSPDMPGAPELWMLGSSPASAELAAKLGLPYAFAHFIGPEPVRVALEHYHSHVTREAATGAGRTILAVSAISAYTDAEAQRLFASLRLVYRRMAENNRGPIPTPEEALTELATGPDPLRLRPTGEWPRAFVGTPESVRARLTAMAEALKVDELMIVTITHDHQARRRSYELLAEAFGLTPRQV